MTHRAVDVSGYDPIAADPGPAPLLQWVAISDLAIDDSYQRPLAQANWTRIKAIAKAFHWSKFSPLVVAPLPDGRFALIDVQHRAHAALMCGIAQVPALVVSVPPGDQARAFVGINTVTLRVSAQAMFKAAVAAGEPWAVDMDRVARAAGCRMATYTASARDRKAYVIYTPGLIRKAIDEGHGAIVTAALDALRAYDVQGRPALWTDYILRPWIQAVTTSAVPLRSLTRANLLAVLNRREPFKVLEAGDTTGASTRVGGAASIWRAMLRDVVKSGAQT